MTEPTSPAMNYSLLYRMKNFSSKSNEAKLSGAQRVFHDFKSRTETPFGRLTENDWLDMVAAVWGVASGASPGTCQHSCARCGAWHVQWTFVCLARPVCPRVRAGRISDMLSHASGRIRSVTPLSIAVLSLSMSADAFAASIGRGASQRPTVAVALKGGLVFGVVEAITPLVGWALGLAAASYVAAVDHWIAFLLLGLVGGKMVWEGFQPEADDPERQARRASPWTLVATAVGTSIDAAAVGVSLAFLGSDIVTIALSIGFATFAMTTIGMLIGRAVGHRMGKIVEVLGGLALIALGTSILVEHLGLFA